VVLGRKSHNAHLNNLHISREQAVFELKPDAEGRLLICMTNVRVCLSVRVWRGPRERRVRCVPQALAAGPPRLNAWSQPV
jgi:hypothetical protein